EGVSAAGGAAVHALAKASGSVGMVGGQVEDLAAEGETDRHSIERLAWIHDHKTAALITASLLVGAHAGAGQSSHGGSHGVPVEVLQLLRNYGDRLGRAFQIADDCLDMTATSAELGKNPGVDVAHGKLTWPSLLGLEASLQSARNLAGEAASLASQVVSAAAAWRGVARSSLDGAAQLLQDVAF